VWEVDARLTAQGICSLLIDGVSYVTDVTDQDGACVVDVGDETYVVRVEEDENSNAYDIGVCFVTKDQKDIPGVAQVLSNLSTGL